MFDSRVPARALRSPSFSLLRGSAPPLCLKLSWSSGLPTFDKLRFAQGESAQTITIRVETP